MKALLFRQNNIKTSSVKHLGLLSLFILSFSLIFFSSCSDNDDEEARRYLVSVTVNYPDGYTGSTTTPLEVKAINAQTGSSVSATTDANGVAQFNLIAGVYNFTVTQETEEFAFNGLKENITVSIDQAVSIALRAKSIEGGLVFKEYYYSGSKTESGGSYYSDQFFEIYNNSDEVIYLDNLGLGTIDPATSNSASVWVDNNGNLLDKLPLVFYSFYIKGTGKDHPLAPRTSIVIAQDGIDHRTDPLGNPNSPVNLGNASWETFVGDINGGKDADAAGVPNLALLSTTSTTLNDALYSVFGPALIMFQFPEGVDPAVFAAKTENLAYKPGTSASTQYLMIPKEYVVDAIECVNNDAARRFKRLPADLDAGYTFITDGTYSGKSVRRKVKQIIDGKVIYKDTNNSTEDFLRDQVPAPFVHPTSVDN